MRTAFGRLKQLLWSRGGRETEAETGRAGQEELEQEAGKRDRQKGEQGAFDAGPTWLRQGKQRGRGRDSHEGAGGSLA